MKRTLLLFGLILGLAQLVSAQVQDKDNVTHNKRLVLDFYQTVFGDKDLTHVDDYLLPTYIQHNQHVADGRAAFKKAAAGWFVGAKKTKIDFRHVAAEGDLVFVHVRNVTPAGKVQAVVDIFRIQDGKIAEHWDVHELAIDSAANSHPLF